MLPFLAYGNFFFKKSRAIYCLMTVLFLQVNMSEKDYQRKKNKFLPKIHAWYCSLVYSNYFLKGLRCNGK